MRPRRAIARFFLLLAFFYALLMMPWPGLQNAYARVFESGAESLFGSFGPDGLVRFVPSPAATGRTHTDILLSNRRTGANGWARFSSRAAGYAPAAFLIALALSTPLPLRRKVWALLLGMLLLHAFIALKLLLTITHLFSVDRPVALFNLSEFWREILRGAVRLVAFAPFFSLVVPTFIWILVTFRRDDIETILDRMTAGRPG